MRNLKKILALGLAMLMMLSCFAFVTSADEVIFAGSKEDTNDHINTIQFLNAIDVYQGYGDADWGSTDKVTRWQMALFLARSITGKTDDSEWGERETSLYFNDTTSAALAGTGGEYAAKVVGAIDLVASEKIIEGYGDGKFGPNDGITYRDALTMVVRALGYETTSMSYPWGHILQAVKLGLNDDVAETKYEAALTRGDIAEIIRNFLSTNIAEGYSYNVNGDLVQIDKDDYVEYDYLWINFKAYYRQAVLAATDSYAIANTTKATSDNVRFRLFDVDGIADGSAYQLAADKVELPKGYEADDAKAFIGYSFQVILQEDGNGYKAIGAFINDFVTVNNFGSVDGDTNAERSKDTVYIDTKNTHLVAEIKGEDVEFIPVNALNAIEEDNGLLVYAPNATTAQNVDVSGDVLVAVDKSDVVDYIQDATHTDYYSLTFIDDENDGTYNRAIYTPFTMGIYRESNIKDTNKEDAGNKDFVFLETAAQSAVGGDDYYWASTINFAAPVSRKATATGSINTLGANYLDAANKDNITFNGAASDGDFIVYNMNTAANVLTIAVNLGGYANLPKGTVTKYSGSAETATIDGTAYGVGTLGLLYGVSVNNFEYYLDSMEQAMDNGIDIHDNLGKNFKYLTLNGRIIYLELIDEEEASSVYAIDVDMTNTYLKKGNRVAKDDVTLNDNNTFDIKAYNLTTGAYETIEVYSINDTRYGVLYDNGEDLYGNKMAKGTLFEDFLAGHPAADTGLTYDGDNLFGLFMVVGSKSNAFKLETLEFDNIVDQGYGEKEETVEAINYRAAALDFGKLLSNDTVVSDALKVFKKGIKFDDAKLNKDINVESKKLVTDEDTVFFFVEDNNGVVTTTRYEGAPANEELDLSGTPNGANANIRLISFNNDIVVVVTDTAAVPGNTALKLMGGSAWAASAKSDDPTNNYYVALTQTGIDGHTKFGDTSYENGYYETEILNLFNLETWTVENVTIRLERDNITDILDFVTVDDNDRNDNGTNDWSEGLCVLNGIVDGDARVICISKEYDDDGYSDIGLCFIEDFADEYEYNVGTLTAIDGTSISITGLNGAPSVGKNGTESYEFKLVCCSTDVGTIRTTFTDYTTSLSATYRTSVDSYIKGQTGLVIYKQPDKNKDIYTVISIAGNVDGKISTE